MQFLKIFPYGIHLALILNKGIDHELWQSAPIKEIKAMLKHVLLIDDEKTILIAFKKLLECPGVEVDTAETMEDAETLLDKRSYAAVIADLRLSGISGEEGLDVIRYVKYRYPESHVILITAYGSPDVMKKAYSLGASHYFEKPVSTHVLKDALKSLGIVFKTVWDRGGVKNEP